MKAQQGIHVLWYTWRAQNIRMAKWDNLTFPDLEVISKLLLLWQGDSGKLLQLNRPSLRINKTPALQNKSYAEMQS